MHKPPFSFLLLAGLMVPYLLTDLPQFLLLLLLASSAFLALLIVIKFQLGSKLTSLCSVDLIGQWLPGLLVFVLAACWTVWHLQDRLDHRLSPELDQQVVTIQGRVVGLPEVLPDRVRFVFSPNHMSAQLVLPERLLVSWYQNPPPLASGDVLELALKLRSPRGRVNFNGHDREQWLFANGYGAVAVVQNQPWSRINSGLISWREQVRDYFHSHLAEHPARPLLIALAVADRSQLNQEHWALMRSTGTSHLLAISGLHIGLAALLGFWLLRGVCSILPQSMNQLLGLKLPWLAAIALALVYAWLAGFGLPTQRALLMLCVLMGGLLFRHQIPAYRYCLYSGILILVIDPLAPLQAGFWLSFMAVVILLLYFRPRKRLTWWRSVLMAQLVIGIALLPFSLAWFGVISPGALVANLLAVPWVSLIVVPLILAGLILWLFYEPLATVMFEWAADALMLLQHWLVWVVSLLGDSQPLAIPDRFGLSMAVIGGLLMLLPKAFYLRLPGFVLWVQILIPRNDDLIPGDLRLELLDIGQGLAMIVQSQNHSLLYDTGPGDGQSWNLVDATLIPSLAHALALPPDKVLVSHGDLDHAGGLKQLQQRYPEVEYIATGEHGADVMACHTGLAWQWDGVDFEVLHPSPYLPYLGNDSSCVLSIRNGERKWLLTGDISAVIEQRLVDQDIGHYELITVPHHGSASSSSRVFVEHLQTEIALLSTGWMNRFGFPKPEVTDVYKSNDVRLFNTADCGGIRITGRAGDRQLLMHSARDQRRAIWRFAPGKDCP